MHPAALPPDTLLNECTVRHERRSGPGGQHRNKVETGIVIVHNPTGIRGEASERRSQAENRSMAVFRLRLALAVQHRVEAMDTDIRQPSQTWQSRIRGKQIVVSGEHEDFPALLAECLDVLDELDFDLARAATFFNVSSSQLVRILKKHPPALQVVNQARESKGVRRLL